MSYVIKLEGLEFRARQGCYDVEQRVGGNFVVDITLTISDLDSGVDQKNASVEGAIESDDVTRTVNYVEVYEVVKQQMEVPSRIIENVADRIARAVRGRFPQVERVEVTLSKLAPPIGGKAARVSVVIAR
jgi:dihydroneopterin aldolase